METTTANRRTIPMVIEIHTILETPVDVELPSKKRGRTLVSYNLPNDFVRVQISLATLPWHVVQLYIINLRIVKAGFKQVIYIVYTMLSHFRVYETSCNLNALNYLRVLKPDIRK